MTEGLFATQNSQTLRLVPRAMITLLFRGSAFGGNFASISFLILICRKVLFFQIILSDQIVVYLYHNILVKNDLEHKELKLELCLYYAYIFEVSEP